MRIHKYAVHFDEDFVGEDDIHGLFVISHGYDLMVSVCDNCVSEFETKYSDHPRSYGGVYKSWAACNFCKVVVLGVDESEPEPKLPQESKQLEFDFMKGN